MNGHLYLFGNLKLQAGGDLPPNATISSSQPRLFDTGSPKTQSLLAYFALHTHQPLERRRLAFLLWPRTTERAARRNLRQYLHRLRQVLEPLSLNECLQDIDGGRILFDPSDRLWIDVLAFENAISTLTSTLSTQKSIPPLAWDTLELYQGELLPDIYDDWITPIRTHWQQQYIDFLETLLQHMNKTQQEIAQSVLLAERLVQADPFRERSHRLLMENYYLNGDRAKAIQQFEQCEQLLDEALGATPMPSTLMMYQQIREGIYPTAPTSDQPDGLQIVENTPPKTPSLTTILPSNVEPNAPAFIARANEITQLDQLLGQVQHGRGQLVVIQGESGIGKTRLVQEWLYTNADQLTLFTGHCREFEMMMPYHSIAEAVHAQRNIIDWGWFDPPPPWLSSVTHILPELSSHFSSLPPASGADGATDRHYLSEGIGRFLLTLAEHTPQPLTLFLDDVHWADAATWQLLSYLGWRCAELPMLIIATCQSELLPSEAQRILRGLRRYPQHITSLELLRLSPTETQQLAGFLLDDPTPNRTLLSHLYRETEGNPLFIIEMVKAWLADDGRQRRQFQQIFQEPSELPATVQSSIETRLDLLDETSRLLLSTAAAIGRTFNFRVLATVNDLAENDIINALESWLHRGLVVETTDGYDFSHDKIRAVAYGEMSRARRQIIHRRIAQGLEGQTTDEDLRHPARLSHHYLASDEPHLALPHLLKAGELSLTVRSYQEAREFGMQAMRLLRQQPQQSQHQSERLDLNLQLATAYAFTGEIDRALPILQESERLARTQADETRLARIFHRSAQILWLRGECRLADEYARRLLRSAEELNDSTLLHASLRMLGRANITLSAFDDAIAYLLRYTKLDDTLHPPADLPVIYGYLAVAYARVGSWDRAFEAGQRGVELAEASNSSSTLTVAYMNLAFIYAERQHWSECLEIAQRVTPFCDEVGLSPYCFVAKGLAGRALVNLGEVSTGLQVLKEALAWANEVGHKVFTYAIHLFFADALIQDGKPVQALTYLAEHNKLVDIANDRWAKALQLRLRAEASSALANPNWLAIEQDLIQAAHLLRTTRARPDLARTYLTLRRLYDRAGELSWAVDCHFRAISVFDELKMIDELREAQGYASAGRRESVVLPNLPLRGPNQAV